MTEAPFSLLDTPFLHKCDALQQNREQVAQAYFEIWAIKLA